MWGKQSLPVQQCLRRLLCSTLPSGSTCSKLNWRLLCKANLVFSFAAQQGTSASFYTSAPQICAANMEPSPGFVQRLAQRYTKAHMLTSPRIPQQGHHQAVRRQPQARVLRTGCNHLLPRHNPRHLVRIPSNSIQNPRSDTITTATSLLSPTSPPTRHSSSPSSNTLQSRSS